jgi:pimeloyl-ACP methyl ester carboxylesterase
VYPRHKDYALAETVADMMELLEAMGVEKAIWVGHDWGSPSCGRSLSIINRCDGVVNLCVPYIPEGFTPDAIISLSDRKTYPEERFPAARWDYQLFYRELSMRHPDG